MTDTCLLCGISDRDVEHTWIRYLEPFEGKQFGTTNRCKDRAKCRARVEARGETWEVDDSSLLRETA